MALRILVKHNVINFVTLSAVVANYNFPDNKFRENFLKFLLILFFLLQLYAMKI